MRRILLVDDDEVYAETTSRVLRRAGFEVLLATHFEPALKMLEAEPPIDLLITDVVMPGSVNGIALSRMARMRRRDLRVVYLTGYSIPGIEDSPLGPVLRKPVDEAVLIATIEQALAADAPP